MSQDNQRNKILELLKIAPRTPTEVANHLKLSREHTTRTLMLPMKEEGLIAKIDGTNKYQLRGQSVTAHQVERMLADESKFKDCQVIINMREATTGKGKEKQIKTIELICLGKKYKGFRINPDSIAFPEDIKTIVALERKRRNIDRLTHAFRQSLRDLVQNGLKHPLSKTEAKTLGIDGDKGKPHTSRLFMTDKQYDDIKEILKQDKRLFCEFGFNFWTFVRPSIRYTVEVDDLEFYDRTVTYAELPSGKRISDKDTVDFIATIKPELIKKYTHRACRMQDVLEFKTETGYPKYIFDDDYAKAIEEFCKSRKHQGYRYLFWDDNKTEFDRLDYDRIVRAEVRKTNDIFMELFTKVGFKSGDFGGMDRANYAFRHFGIQKWLQLTDYDYGFIKTMGHKDINTLIDWYGGMIAEYIEKEMSEIII